jgi:hypothetical protein
MKSTTEYALRGAAYEIQKTLEAFFGYCEVQIFEKPEQCQVVFDVSYRTPGGMKKYCHAFDQIRHHALDKYNVGYIAEDLPHRIVMEELASARLLAGKRMNLIR